MEHHRKLAILVAGGPAPGINSVIGAATIRAALEGIEVLGVRDGFEWLMHGDIDHVTPLTIDAVSRIHFRGGSHIGISRTNPTVDPALLEVCHRALSSMERRKVRRRNQQQFVAVACDGQVPATDRRAAVEHHDLVHGSGVFNDCVG